MPVTVPRDEEMAARARALYVPGVFGIKRVARELGCSATSVRRYVSEDTHEKMRVASLAYKRSVAGSCEDCGRKTRYNGRTNAGASRLCPTCAAKQAGIQRRGVGQRASAVLALLADSGPMRRSDIVDAVGNPNATTVLLNRLIRYGLITRMERGVYTLAKRS